MAWQLIYTSAPRLLEAGRSGFGTVARHRQISPLLVSAIERASQFARLPGLNAERVIYGHRIVAVAGGRFHVLSCIRDAGADYTGRTNHLAHHVIAEQREVAALGARGASAADVLLGMSWLGAWEEAPRFLEASDEIALASFPAQASGQWAQATGDARHAWLLVTGEASRGAYLLHAPGTDLRALFAESLRLSPDRLWQVPFTTALQPSDEISDFRWIGVEADSTLRAAAESSGRPVLDLTQPGTLPAPEVPANALTIGIPRPTARGAAPVAMPAAPPTRIASSVRRAVPFPAAPKPRNFKWLYAGIAALLAAAVAFGVIRSQSVANNVFQAQRESLVKKVRSWGDFSPQASEFFSHLSAEKLSSADQVLVQIEKAVASLKPVNFDKMADCKSGGDLRALATPKGIELPAELTAFADNVHTLHSLNVALSKPAASERAAFETLQKQRADIEAFAKEMQAMNLFSDATRELRKKHERAEAAVMFGLLHPRGSKSQHLPPADAEALQQWLGRGKPADAEAAGVFSKAEKLMNAWKFVQDTRTDRVADDLAARLRESRSEWPDWLVKLAETALAKSRGSAPPPPAAPGAAVAAPSAPSYFFSSVDAVRDARFQELEKGLTWLFRHPPAAAPVPLIDPTRQGNLRRQVTDPAMFVVDDSAKTIDPKSADDAQRPFVLLARNAGGKDAMQIWVLEESDKPLLGKRADGLSRARNTLALDAARLGIPGVPASRVTLRLPPNCAIPGRKSESLIVKDWSADLGPLCAEIERLRDEKERTVKNHESALAPVREADVAARLADLKRSIAETVAKEIADWAVAENAKTDRKENDEKKRADQKREIERKRMERTQQMARDFAKEGAAPFQQVGGCIKALAHEATFSGHDTLFDAGAELSFLKPDADVKILGAKFDAALVKVQTAIDHPGSLEEGKRYALGLATLKAMIALTAPETPKSKTLRMKVNSHLMTELEKSRSELSTLAAHPLLGKGVPPGAYQLSVFAEGAEIPLVEIEAAR